MKPPKPRPAPSGRERILASALRLFGKKGYAGTTVREILHAAGVKAPALYHHFGSKEGVFLALVRDGLAERDRLLAQGVPPEGTAEERIRGYCRATASVRLELADLGRIVEGILDGAPSSAPHFDFPAIVARTVEALESLVREGIEAGEFRECDARRVALALLGTVEVVARPHVFGTVTEDDDLDGMVGAVMAGIRSN